MNFKSELQYQRSTEVDEGVVKTRKYGRFVEFAVPHASDIKQMALPSYCRFLVQSAK